LNRNLTKNQVELRLPSAGRLFYITKGECVMTNDKDNVYWGDLEGRDFKEISEMTKPKETDKDGIE